MPVTIRCPNPACGASSVLEDGQTDKPFRCPSCGKTVSFRRSADERKSGSDATTTRSLPVAKRIGRFEVRERLGAGAFGTVYRAYDPQLDREVALKVPNAGVLDSPKRIERFLREAKSAANLRHPNIVPLYDAGKDGEQYYIASAFINGQKLADALDASEGGLELKRAARLVRELAEALAYAHEQGIVHRDVKPDNVMLDAADRVHLMDFGLAARRDEESKLTNDGAVMGTPSYMAPEQAAGQQGEAQPAADQYAVGVVLYELLTGKTPFSGPVQVVIHSQIHTEPEKPTKFRPDVPKDLETVCLKAMNKRPEERYSDCQALADDLRRWHEGEPIAARRMSSVERLGRWVKKNKAVAALSAAVATSLICGVVISISLAASATEARQQAEGVARSEQAERERAERLVVSEQAQRERAETLAKSEQVERERAEKLVVSEQSQRGRAETLALSEQSQRERAETLAKGEKEERQKTQLALNETRAAKLELENSQRKTKLSSYGAYLSLARLYLQNDQLPLASRSLKAADPQLRGWEWRWLSRSVESGRNSKNEIDANHKPIAASFSSDATMCATITADGTIRMIDCATGKSIWANNEKLEVLGTTLIAISPDGKHVVTAGLPNADDIILWDALTGKKIREFDKVPPEKTGRQYEQLSISNGGKWVAVVDRFAGGSAIWDLTTGKVAEPLSLHASGCAFLPDGDQLVFSRCQLNQVQVFQQSVGGKRSSLYAVNSNVYRDSNIAVSPDGKFMVLTTEESSRIISIQNKKLIHTLKGHDGIAKHIIFVNDGTQLLREATTAR